MKSRRRPVKRAATKFPLVDKIALWLNIFAVLCLLLSYLAPSTDPRDWSIIAILGFGYLGLLAVNILFIIYWLFRKKSLALMSAISIALGFNFIMLNYGFHKASGGAEKAPGQTIRMMAYNVHSFKGIEANDDNPVQDQIIQVIKDNQPDILSIEEYSSRDSLKGAVADSISKTLKYHYFQVFHINREDTVGNAIFSKYPIALADSIPSPKMLNTRAMFADIKVFGKVIRVYSVHLAAVTIKNNEKRDYLDGNVSLNKGSFIQTKLATAFVRRSYQVSRIKDHIAKCQYPYIVAGDFNDTPVSFSVNELGEGCTDAFKEKGSGFVSTYYSSFPLQIDHIMASRQFNILNYQAIDKKISDHKPIISDLQLK